MVTDMHAFSRPLLAVKEETRMSRFFVALIVALGCASGMAIQAQETKTKTETKVEGGQPAMMSYAGCVQTGAETKSYMLEKVVPVGRTTTREATGTGGVRTTTTTTYALVPGEKVEFQQFVGRKVEVTGMMIPAGETKTKTTIERENAPDTKITEKTKSDTPQFRVVSIKQTGEAC